MNDETPTAYPGSKATPTEVLALADAYRDAAEALFMMGRKGQPRSRAPSRLCAVHAIELYLNAFLVAKGSTTTEIRSQRHDLSRRHDKAEALGLVLRKSTSHHLQGITASREYLISRYGAEMDTKLSEINRLQATLKEVAEKVRKHLSSI